MKKELLMKKYKSGEIGPEEEILIEKYLEEGILQIEELEDLDKLHEAANPVLEEIPSNRMKEQFYNMLSSSKQQAVQNNIWNRFWGLLSMDLPSGQYYRIAFTIGLLVVGIFAGWLISPAEKYQDQLANINSEVHQMKEMMMLSMLEKPSASDRLQAVSMSSELPSSYGRVIEALFNTLNQDENVNVRLAALEVLAGYTDDAYVRENLIKSIGMQESPLVQVEMANVMVALQEKASVEELKKLLDKENTPPEIKTQLQESIGKLI